MKKKHTRIEQQNANKNERELSKFLGQSVMAQKIGRSHKAINLYKNIYNSLCDDCRAICIKSGGRAALGEYCFECQETIKPILQDINELLSPK